MRRSTVVELGTYMRVVAGLSPVLLGAIFALLSLRSARFLSTVSLGHILANLRST